MQDNKGEIKDINAADEALLRDFFAQSARMTIDDDGFSKRVMERVTAEMPLAQRMVCGAWAVLCMALSVALFIFKDGATLLKDSLMNYLSGAWSNVVYWTNALVQSWHMPDMAHVSYSTPLLIIVALVVFSSVALYNVVESDIE